MSTPVLAGSRGVPRLPLATRLKMFGTGTALS
jgi:hypothetical protein